MTDIKQLVTAEAVKEVIRSEEVRSVLKQKLRQNLEERLDEPPRVSWRVFYL